MQNPDSGLMPMVSLELGGVTRRLVFDFNAQAQFEEVSGATALSLFDRRGRLKISARYTRALLWAQLLHHDPQVQFDEFGRITEPPELSMQDVGRLITRQNLQQVNQAVLDAVILFFKPEKEKKQEGEGEQKKKDPPRR